MSIIQNMEIDIQAEEVARLMKSGSKQSGAIRGVIEEEIENCRLRLAPRITLEEIGIHSVEEDRVILQNGVVFEGDFMVKKLAHCSAVIVTASTLGLGMDEYINECFDGGDYLRGLAADSVAVTALGNLGKQLWNKLVAGLKEKDFGITSRLSPGDTGWVLEEQKKLFACLEGNDTDITLLDSGMMLPLKSASAVYGIGKGIGITRFGHVCSECRLKDCPYRQRMDITVKTGGDSVTVAADYGENLYELLQQHQLLEAYPCAGKGICGKCRVRVLSGAPVPSPEDERHFTPDELERGERLACRISVAEPMELLVGARGGSYAILTDGAAENVPFEPSVLKKYFRLKKAGREDGRSDVRRLAEAMGLSAVTVGLPLLRRMAGALHGAEDTVTATVYNDTLTDIESGNTETSCYGAAVDIGTTTVVCYLVDLSDGRTVDAEAEANRQSAYGADVISRIGYTAGQENGTRTLRDLIIGQINGMVERLCARNAVEPRHLYHMTVAGNTTMLHFFLGLPSENIALAPFTPVTTDAQDFQAAELGIRIGGVVSVLPGIASYVGSDITAGILASGMAEAEGYSLLLDLGTNGEMALGNKQRLFTCSVAAGPAFEGGNIQQGVGGIQGAVCAVDFAKNPVYRTIGDGAPVGICGSGVLDTVSELLKDGLIDETGRMAAAVDGENADLGSRLQERNGIRQFVLENEPFIAFSQKDVREVQLAKAAFSAGIQVLLKELKLNFQDIDKVYVAGGFGSYMDINSAFAIGLIPAELKGKTISIGNAAGAGARLCLLSKSCRQKAADIVKRASYIELSNRAEFQEYYLDNMGF